MSTDFKHYTVMKEETIQSVLPSAEGKAALITSQAPFVFVDCTLGGGGHTQRFMEEFFRKFPELKLRVVGFDRDSKALDYNRKKFDVLQLDHANQVDVTLIHSEFSQLEQKLQQMGLTYHGLIADLGVSSPQLDESERGFSFLREGPLDMRMDNTQTTTAKDLITTLDLDALTHIFRHYGEEPAARKLAKAIIADRQANKLPTESSTAFAEYAARVLNYKGSRNHPATRTFQALRIAVNDELGELERLLTGVVTCRASHAKASFISFHSLEDKLVKKNFRSWQEGCFVGEKPKLSREDLIYGTKPKGWGKEAPRGGLAPRQQEIEENARSRSARLRTFHFSPET